MAVLFAQKCVSFAGTEDVEMMVGETKRLSNAEEKDVAFFEGSDFHRVQAHLHLDNFLIRLGSPNLDPISDQKM